MILSACPLDKQLSNFACLGQLQYVLAKVDFLVLKSLLSPQMPCPGLACQASKQETLLALQEDLLVP